MSKVLGWTFDIVNLDILCRCVNQLCQMPFQCLPDFKVDCS